MKAETLALTLSILIPIIVWYLTLSFVCLDWCWAAHIKTEWRVFSVVVLIGFIVCMGRFLYNYMTNEF